MTRNARGKRVLWTSIIYLALLLILSCYLRAEIQSNLIPTLLRSGHYAEGISACMEAIELNPKDISVYSWLFQALEQTGALNRATVISEVTRRMEKLLQEHPGDIYLHYGLGVTYQKQDNYALAHDHLRKSISLGANFWEVYSELVNSYVSKKDIEDTSAFLQFCLKLNPTDPFLYEAIGLTLYYSSEYSEACVSIERAKIFFHQRGATADEGRCLLNLSEVKMYMNDYPNALRDAQLALEISQKTGDKGLEIQCLEHCSFIWSDLGKDAKASEACQKAMILARQMGYRPLEVLCNRTWGVILHEKGDLTGAQKFLSEALAYYEQTRALRSLDVCLYWLTLLYKDKGDYSRAMASAHEGLQISQQIGFKTGEAFHLTTIGDIHLALGNYEKALEFNKEALSAAELCIGKWSREQCLNTIGYVYVELNDYGLALKYFQESLEYIRRIGHRREEAQCLYNIGFAYNKLGDFSSAFEFFSKSLDVAGLTGKRILQAQNYNRLGDLYRQRGLWDKSKICYDLALDTGRDIKQPNVIWEAYAGLGALLAAEKKYAAAIDNYKSAIGVIEDIRLQLLLSEYSSGFFRSKIAIYETLIGLLLDGYEMKPSPEALEECLYYAEKAKARSFLDDLRKAKIYGSCLSHERSNELEQISQKISHLSSELSNISLSLANRVELQQTLEKAEDDYELYTERARAENPDYFRAVSNEPCRLPEIREKLLDRKTGILEYLVGENNIYIFFITAANFSAIRLSRPESLRALRLVSNYIGLLSSRTIANTDIFPAGRKLYDVLIGSVAQEDFSSIKNLIVIPDKILSYLPFEALIIHGKHNSGHPSDRILFEDYDISYAPSASSLISLRDRRAEGDAGDDLLLIGNPILDRPVNKIQGEKRGDDVFVEYYLGNSYILRPLQFASREMEFISRLMAPGTARIMSGSEATKDKIKQVSLGKYDVLHFATHSLLDEIVASRSALLLSKNPQSDEDGFLQVREIYNMKLNADLVVLSACQTARGKMEKGEGILGLCRAFLCSGARSVVASLWNVNDESTSQFMQKFYGFLTDGKTIQESLRLTKLYMCNSNKWRPCHWATFVLIGDGGNILRLHKSSFWSRLPHF